MSHLLSSVNPEAARAADGKPELPEIADMVIFYPRPGELRAGRGKHAAIVVGRNEETGTLDLVVIFDADDMIGQREVPRRSLDGGMGWEPRERKVTQGGGADPTHLNQLAAAIEKMREELASLASLRAIILGDYEAPPESLLTIIDEHEDRMEKLEAKVAQGAPPDVTPAKRAKGKTPKGK